MRQTILLFLLFLSIQAFTQVLPSERSVDWTIAGLRDTSTFGFEIIDLEDFGLTGDGSTSNDLFLSDAFASMSGDGSILLFPAGNFLFNSGIVLQSNMILRGQGAENTTLTFDQGGVGYSIVIQGNSSQQDTSSLVIEAQRDSNFIHLADANNFEVGDLIQMTQNDIDLTFSAWAFGSVGQIAEIIEVIDNKLTLNSPLRMSYELSRDPFIRKIDPKKNIGIECLKIHRLDNTATEQYSNLFMNYASNCWVDGIESENCTFAHLEASRSSNLEISNSYFHHAFEYGSGGRAYGTLIQSTSNECLIQNSIFEHLRHSMIVQSGANGNVFAYNYSFDTFWTSFPENAAGDLVFHGNYPYANLAENNIVQNIVFDNSHGLNGPYNTVFRNRAELFGIIFTEENSAEQNIIGNECTNTDQPYSLLNYSIQGNGQFEYGNNDEGTIIPSGTEILDDISYAFISQPSYISISQFGSIGTPNSIGTGSIPAFDRWSAGSLFANICGNGPLSSNSDLFTDHSLKIYPNPFQERLVIVSDLLMEKVSLIDVFGKNIAQNTNAYTIELEFRNIPPGCYVVAIEYSNKKTIFQKLIHY